MTTPSAGGDDPPPQDPTTGSGPARTPRPTRQSAARASAPKRKLRRTPPSKERRQGSAILLSALVAPIATATPVDSAIGDALWLAGLAAVAALFGSTAKRGPLLVAVILAVVSSRSLLALAFAAVAIAFGALSTRKLRRRAFFARGLVGGAATISVCISAPEQPWWYVVGAGLVVSVLIVGSGLRNAPPQVARRAVWAGIGMAVFAGGASALALVGAMTSANEVDAGTVELRLGLSAARRGDVSGATEHLARAEVLFGEARSAVARFGVLGRAVPVTAQHVNALTKVLEDVTGAAAQAARTAGTVDDLDLTVRSGLVDLEAIARLENPLRRLAGALGELVAESQDQRRGPLLPVVEDRLRRLEEEATRAEREANDGAQAAAVMPEMLGASSPKRYLVLVTSPAEARGRLGFPSSFAEIRVDRGRLLLDEHGSVSETFRDLQADQLGFPVGDDGLQPYLPYGATQTFLSATIPPDFQIVAQVAARLWESSGRPPIDGVLQLDPSSLAGLLDYTGAVQAPTAPAPLDSGNLESFLLFDQYLQFPTDQAPRRELLETVADVTFERLVSADLPAPRVLVDRFGPLVRTGHLHITSFDPDAARFLARVGLDGRFEPPTSDGLFVTNVNSSGNKIDTFLSKTVAYDATVDANGHLEGTVTVELTNAAPPARLPSYVIGSSTRPPLPRGTNRTTLLVYTAVQGQEVRIDGQPAYGRVIHTDGWWLQELLVELPPGSTRSVEVRLAGELPSGTDAYQLRIEPGGAPAPDAYRVTVHTDRGDATYGGSVIAPTLVG